ncbi:MAG: hypothetical protein IJK81_06530 [Selenomonadaceae bacterium]|nr:hypothetical protein [Selenomonadaceae bacterium]
MKYLDTTTASGVTALNNAVKACSSFGSLQNVIDKLISDCQSAQSADNFLKEKCGIILDNDDTGAITGSDAGDSKVKTAESILTETGEASYPPDTSFTKRGLTVIVPEKSTLDTDQQTVVQGLYSWWIEEALKLIEESYGYSFTDSDTTVQKITLQFIDNLSAPLAYVTNNSTSTNGSSFKTTELTLTVNMSHFKDLSISDVNGKSNANYLDRTIAHELTHAIMAAKIDDAQELPNFITEGMAELTHGADERASDIRQLVNNPTQLEARLDISNKGNVSPTDLDYAAGYIFLRYLAKQGSDSFPDETINYIISDDNTNITAGGTYTIAKDFSGTITINTTDAVTIDGTDTGDLKNVRIVTSSAIADLTIKNLNITNDTGGAITFSSSTDNKLTLAGKNVLKTSDTWAAVVNIGGGLTIDGTGSLDVTSGSQGSGIGYNSYGNSTANLTINGGTITATADTGAGIGSGFYGVVGNITINSGNVTATSEDGAGIGAGCNGSVENIIISGGDVTAQSKWGAGLGTGRAYENEKSSVEAITINGSSKVTATSEYGLGIGKGTIDKITDIESGSVTVGKVIVGKITVSGKSYVLITRMDNVSLVSGRPDPSIVINDSTYNDEQILFENGVKKNLTERLIIKEIVKNGTDEADYIGVDNSSWYNAYTINAGAGDDTIDGAGANILIYAGKGNDSVKILGMGWSDPVAGYLTVDGGAGDDTLSIGTNFGGISDYYSSINGGMGNDSIRVYGNYVTIEGDAGNDDLIINGEHSTVDGGAGNDSILVNDENNTVSGGAGNDLIKNESSTRFYTDSNGKFLRWAENENVTYRYTAGDGNDTIEGYTSENKLQIFGDSYTRSTVGADVIIKVGKGSITLKDAKYKTINIDGEEKPSWKLNGTTATYGTELENLITVSGVKSLDGIFLKGKVVTVSAKSLNKKNVTISDGYTLKLGNDVTKSKNSVATLINGKYTTAGVSQTGYKLENNSISYVKKDTKTFKFSGLTSTALAKNIKVDADAQTVQIDSSIVKKSGSIIMTSAPTGYSLSRTVMEKAPATSTKTTFKNGKYTLANVTSAGYNLNGKKISYVARKSKTKLELTGVASKPSAPKNGTVTLKPSNFDKNITVSSNAGKYKFSIAKGTYTGKIFTGSSKADTITNAGSELTINTGKGNDSIISSGVKVTINGGDGNDYIKSTGKNSSILGGAGNDSLWGSKGSDTLIGGKGNDSLWGDVGKDTFLYSNGDGKDVIFGFENDDLLQITGTFSASYNKSTEEVSFKVSSISNAITLKDFTATSFNINGNSYKISGTRLK